MAMKKANACSLVFLYKSILSAIYLVVKWLGLLDVKRLLLLLLLQLNTHLKKKNMFMQFMFISMYIIPVSLY